MKKQPKSQPRVYSYVRFSTPEQAMGDSERRQVAGAKDFAQRRSLPLDETLSLTDRGLSGFHGTHRKKGALGNFLMEVEAGNVAPGSILLVENIDRLSREGAVTTLRQIIFKLWDAKITLATLSPEEIYEPDCDNAPKFLALFLFMQRAQDESQRKSERIRHARDQARINAREHSRLLTSQVPDWLNKARAKANGERVPIKEAVATIRRIFEMKLDGIGVRRIAQQLNDDATWTRKNGWRASYIRKLLTNRALIGEYQPYLKQNGKRIPSGEPIKGYFPVVVAEDVFFAVQKALENNIGKGGQTGKANNVLTHLVHCAYCGGVMSYANKGKPEWQYLVCDNGVRKVKCGRYAVKYWETVELILNNTTKLDPTTILPNEDDKQRLIHTLQARIDGNEATINDIDQQITNYVAQIGRSSSETVASRCEAAIVELEQKRLVLFSTVKDDETKLAEAKRGKESFKAWQRDVDALRTAIQDVSAVDARLKLRSHLQRLIERVEIFAVGYPTILTGEESFTRDRRELPQADDIVLDLEAQAYEYFPEVLDDPSYREFTKHVAALRQTSKGRFVRLHFRSGAKVDLVPEGSIASGMTIVRDAKKRAGWRFVSPKLNRLYQDWKTAQKAGKGKAKR